MKNNLFIFAVGIAIGVVSTKSYFKKKSDSLIETEIESVKNTFKKKQERKNTQIVEEDCESETEIVRKNLMEDKPDIMEYASKLKKEKYANYTDSSDKKDECEESLDANSSSNKIRKSKYTNHPYVISPEQFGYLEDYDTVSLTYYADHVLANDDDEITEDIDKVIGLNSLNQFGQYEDDSVFVRDDELMVDYEVLLDKRKFSDIPKANPVEFDIEDAD